MSVALNEFQIEARMAYSFSQTWLPTPASNLPGSMSAVAINESHRAVTVASIDFEDNGADPRHLCEAEGRLGENLLLWYNLRDENLFTFGLLLKLLASSQIHDRNIFSGRSHWRHRENIG